MHIPASCRQGKKDRGKNQKGREAEGFPDGPFMEAFMLTTSNHDVLPCGGLAQVSVRKQRIYLAESFSYTALQQEWLVASLNIVREAQTVFLKVPNCLCSL